jgi:MFS family permease
MRGRASEMTTTPRTRRTIFYGRWIILVAAVGLSMGYGPIVAFTFGVFFTPLRQELGWGRAQVSLAFSWSLLISSCASPVIGRLVDRVGARKVIVPAVVLFGVGLIAFASLSAHLWHLYAI